MYHKPSPYSYTPSLAAMVPTGQRLTLKYADRYTFNEMGVNFGRWEWRGSALFDPDVTGTGHQPKGFDQMAALYRKYLVLGSQITVMFGNKEDTPDTEAAPAKGVLAVKNINTSLTMNELIEQPISTWGIQGTANAPPVKLSLPYVSNWKFSGYKGVNRDTDFSALVTANPVSNFYYEFFCERGGDSHINMQLHVEIRFDCWFWEPQDLTSS